MKKQTTVSVIRHSRQSPAQAACGYTAASLELLLLPKIFIRAFTNVAEKIGRKAYMASLSSTSSIGGLSLGEKLKAGHKFMAQP